MAAHRFAVWQAEDGAGGGELLQPFVLPDGAPLLLAPIAGRPWTVRLWGALTGGNQRSTLMVSLQPVPGSPGVYRCRPGMPAALAQLRFLIVQ